MVPISHKRHSVVFHCIHTYDQLGFEKINRGLDGNGVSLIALSSPSSVKSQSATKILAAKSLNRNKDGSVFIFTEKDAESRLKRIYWRGFLNNGFGQEIAIHLHSESDYPAASI